MTTVAASSATQRKRETLGISLHKKLQPTSNNNLSPNPLRLNFLPRNLAVKENVAANTKTGSQRQIHFVEAGELYGESDLSNLKQLIQLQEEEDSHASPRTTTSSSNCTPNSITEELTNILEPKEVHQKWLKTTTVVTNNVSLNNVTIRQSAPQHSDTPNSIPKKPFDQPQVNGIASQASNGTGKKYLQVSDSPVKLNTSGEEVIRPKVTYENGKNETSPSTSSPLTNGKASRKRLLSDRGEQESQYPRINRAMLFHNWEGCHFVEGKKCGIGLYNPLNNCFLNSVLQSVVHIPQLARMILESKDSRMCTQSVNQNFPCFHCGLKHHLVRAIKMPNSFRPFWIDQHMRRIFPSHRYGVQEDAHEMLTLLLSALEPALSKQTPNGLKTSGGNPSTPIEQIFGGNLRNEVICNVCRHPHTNYERIREFNLGLTRGNGAPLKVLIDDFFKPEQLQNFLCSKCQKKQTATRRTHLLSSPSVLIIQLKRFNPLGGKNRTQIQIETSLNLSAYSYKEEIIRYKFHGLIEHIGGGLNFGHYICAMRGFDDKNFYHFDDSERRSIELNEIVHMEPYILFYTKLNIPTPAHNRSFDVCQPSLKKRMMGVSPYNSNRGTGVTAMNRTIASYFR